ncbi:PREDICTED: uncharacterized protein LOC109192845 [Ipomoea nil]|uniref:uncharacterized protein LOC109192845 n=1 Tax=Ipomoea nil TaxID=35883 RepID=UPI000900F3F0|nr:PREDICTED: uncharacterized protein LOC109192845 [Ipomoea nil]
MGSTLLTPSSWLINASHLIGEQSPICPAGSSITTTQKVLLKTYPPTSPLENDLDDYGSIGNAIPQLVVTGIILATAVVLFKKNFIDGPGFCRACWTLMLFGSDVLGSTEVKSVTTTLITIHIGVNSLGLSYWIVLDVKEYKRKKTWPSMELLFETGVWFFMFILSWVEFMSGRLLKGTDYFQVYYWYPIAIALFSMIEMYLTRNTETGGDELKSEVIGNGEKAFDDFVRSCLKEPQNDNITKFDQKFDEFIRMLSTLVAQRQEALKIAEQKEAPRHRSRVKSKTNNNDQEIESMDL